MAISRTEMQDFFSQLGINADNKEVNCYKCSLPLYYKSYKYQCDNLHQYNFQDTAFKFAKFLNDLKNDVADKKLCSVNFE